MKGVGYKYDCKYADGRSQNTSYNSFLDVFDLTLGNNRTSMGRFTGIDAPHRPLSSSWHMMDIELRSGTSLSGRGFVAWYMLVDTTVQTNLNSSG
jgi:hypothetical protein